MSITYTNPKLVTEHKVTTAPFNPSISGYGSKLPSRYMVRYDGRWHRVYSICYGNSGSPYIIKNGSRLFLDTDTEHDLQING